MFYYYFIGVFMKKRALSIRDLCLIGVVTSILIIMAQISIPMPLGVPMTMQTFAVMLAGILLGPQKGTLTIIIYLLLGAIGLPVFSNFRGGLQCLIGPTGGFLWTFPIMALLTGFGAKYLSRRRIIFILTLISGNIINLLCGTVFFSILQGITFSAAATTCLLPFIPATLLKIILAAIAGPNIRKRLASILS
jgi:biotin transport system substrate-specific component